MHNAANVADSLWYDTLTVEQKRALERLFPDRRHLSDALDDAYVRGYRQGINMRSKIEECKNCSIYLCKLHSLK